MSTVSTDQENFDSVASWSAVTRVCRRICLLRSTGEDAAARVQSAELARLLSSVPPAADVASRVDAIFATEEKRLADAQVLAEVLAPLIAEQLRARPPALSAPSRRASPAPVDLAEKTAARPPRSAAPNIADFIDDMLAQERPARRAS